jgi:hypothetical protein
MGRELGRISGPLLSANLERDGVDLRFEDDLLYLSVVDTANPSKKVGIGINKLNPTRELFIDNNTHTTNLVVDTWATVGLTGSQFNIINNKIQYDGSIVLQPNQSSDPTIATTRVGTKDYNLSVDYLNISDRLIENLSNNSNIQLTPSITGITQFDTSEIYVNGSLESTGNITFDGDITFGSDASDNVDFKADINSHIIPNITNTYDLGSTLQRWANVYVHGLYANNTSVTSQTFNTLTANGTSNFDGNAYLGNASTDHITFTSLLDNSLIPTTPFNALGIRVGPLVSWNTLFLTEINVDGSGNIVNNTITTLTTDTDLSLSAAGTGKIVVTNTDVEITNNLTVDQLTTLANVDITGLLDLTGDYTWTQTGIALRTGNTDITGSLTVNGAHTVQFEDIKFVSNRITTTLPSSNLVLIANGSGIIKTTVTDVEITNDLNVDLTGDINTVNATTVYANAYDIGSVYITDNIITTNVLNTNLVLSADGAGIIHVITTDVEITNDLEVNQLTTLSNVGITGLLDLTGDYTWTQTGTAHRTGNTDITGSLTVNGANTVQFDDIQFFGNVVKTTLGTDLELQANGAGIVKILTNDVEITNDLDVLSTGYINEVVVINGVDPSDASVDFNVGNISISGNTVATTTGNLILSANNTGELHVTTTDVEITNDLEVNQLTTLANVGITGLLDLTGDYTWTQTGAAHRTGNTDITGSLTVNGAHTVQFDDIQFVGNVVRTTLGTDLELQANGTGIVKILTNDVEITNDLYVTLHGEINTVNATTVTANAYNITDVYITGNSITTDFLNRDLELGADGAGRIYVTTTNVEITNNLNVDTATTLADVGITGLLDLTGDYTWTQTGTAHRTGNTDITGSLTVNGAHTVQFENIKFLSNSITTTVTDSDLTLTADLTKEIHVTTTDVEITNDLAVNDTGYFNTVEAGTVVADSFDIGSVYVTSNVITTNTTNTNLVLEADGTGTIYIPLTDVSISNDLTVAGSLTIDGDSNLINLEIGTIASSKTLTQTGNIDQTGNTYVTGTFTNNGPITITGASSYLSGPEIKIQNHKIKVTATDKDLKFVGTGVGGIVLDNRLKFKDSTISNVWATPTTDTQKSIIFDPDGTGNVVIDSATSLTIPYGNSSNQVLSAVGQIRQNSTTGHYEGWSPNGLVSFTGIYDSDSNTYITPELTFGANDNIIRFGINGVVKQTIDVTKLSNNTIHVDNISISNNSISNLISSNNLEINVTGAGVVNINNVLVKDNTITNVNNSALILESTGTGYVKFGGTGGVVFPAGVDADRRVTPDLGEIRYNTQHNYTEIWDGGSWVSVSGSAAAATEEEVTAETNLWAFVLG